MPETNPLPLSARLLEKWQAFRKVWKYWFFGVAAVAFIAASIVSLLIPPTPAPTQENSWNGITPGATTLYELQQKLGQPISSTPTKTGNELAFTSEYPTIPHLIQTNKQGEVIFIKTRIRYNAAVTLATEMEEFGQPELELFVKDGESYIKAFVFLSRGQVIIARTTDGTIEERWYFEPTTREVFLQQWAADLSSTEPEPERFTIE